MEVNIFTFVLAFSQCKWTLLIVIVNTIDRIFSKEKQQRLTEIDIDAMVHTSVNSWALDYFDALLDS